jgi:sigma-70-like protein
VLDVTETAALHESLSMAFLVLLESLTPVERAVFLLHDVFSYDFTEIAQIVGKSESNCRQLARRARGFIDARLLIGIMRKAPAGLDTRPARVNGQPGFVSYLDGRPFGVLLLDIADARIQGVRLVVNPDKLQHLVGARG